MQTKATTHEYIILSIIGTSKVYRLLTFFLCELVEKTRFPDAHVTDNYVLKDVVVVVWSSRHREYCADTNKISISLSFIACHLFFVFFSSN